MQLTTEEAHRAATLGVSDLSRLNLGEGNGMNPQLLRAALSVPRELWNHAEISEEIYAYSSNLREIGRASCRERV